MIGRGHVNRSLTYWAACFALSSLPGCTSERIVTTQALQSTLIVQARDSSDLNDIAQILGWPRGVVPNAQVTAQLQAQYAYQALTITGSTDSSGTVRLEGVVPGTYMVRVSRPFSQEERARAGSALGGVFQLEGFGTLTIVPGATTMRFDVLVRRLGASSLVFDEIFNVYAQLGSVAGVYTEFAEYLEVYNNADTTVQLAGKLFLQGMPRWLVGGNLTCSSLSDIYGDPVGIWAEWVYRFPPTAPPLAPGAHVLIATDALNFRQFGTGAGLQDLSHADFEFRGSSDADNPLAKDMISVGPEDGGTPLGHGWMSFLGAYPIALADNLNLDTLPHIYKPTLNGGSTWVRVPKAALIDVATTRTTYQSAYQDCPPEVDPGIDAGEARLLNQVDSLSLHRRISDTLPDGRLRFQQSRNSAADFYRGPQTPGTIP